MAKRPTTGIMALTARERALLFCVGSSTDWQRVGITGETVTALIVKGLLVRDGLCSRMTVALRCGRCCGSSEVHYGQPS
jgi:hypothetical protein